MGQVAMMFFRIRWPLEHFPARVLLEMNNERFLTPEIDIPQLSRLLPFCAHSMEWEEAQSQETWWDPTGERGHVIVSKHSHCQNRDSQLCN